jgi:hypothetical protein
MFMRKMIIAGILISTLAATAPLFAQTNASDIAALTKRVAQLERQVQEMSRLLEPMKAQQSVDARRLKLRNSFNKKMQADSAKYTPEQLREAEQLYQVANQKWGSPEAAQSLQTMIQKYPDVNRTGCAVLYVAQMSKGEERAKNLQACVEKYNDCMYGDGVQVGVYARYLLAHDLKAGGDLKKAQALADEIKSKYPDAIDHSGNLLMDSLKAEFN